MDEDLRHARAAGFCAHLVKPVSLDQLRIQLESLVPLPNEPVNSE